MDGGDFWEADSGDLYEVDSGELTTARSWMLQLPATHVALVKLPLLLRLAWKQNGYLIECIMSQTLIPQPECGHQPS